MADLSLGHQYPYPSHVHVPTFVSVKLSGKDNYIMWKEQMHCLIESHDMLGFVNGSSMEHLNINGVSSSCSSKGKETVEVSGRYRLWRRSDSLVKGWILGSLTEHVFCLVVGLSTAEDVWAKLKRTYGPAILQKDLTTNSVVEGSYLGSGLIKSETENETLPLTKAEAEAQEKAEAEAKAHSLLYQHTLEGNWEEVENIFTNKEVAVTAKISTNGSTALHIAIGTGQKIEFVEKLLNLIPPEKLADMRNSEGSTALHVAAIVGNTSAAKLLVYANQKLANLRDKEGYIPLGRAISNMHIDTFVYLMHVTHEDVEQGSPFSGESGVQVLVNAISAKEFVSAYLLAYEYPKLAASNDAALMALAQNFPSDLNSLERLISLWMPSFVFRSNTTGTTHMSLSYLAGRTVRWILSVFVSLCYR